MFVLLFNLSVSALLCDCFEVCVALCCVCTFYFTITSCSLSLFYFAT